MQTIFQKFGVEIDQQADPVSAQPEIGQHLRYMHRKNALHRLYFEKNGVLHHDVGTVAARQAEALINQRQRRLPDKCQTTVSEFPAKTLLVRLFQQARSQRPMNFYRQSDDLPGAIPGQTRNAFFFVKSFNVFLIFVRHLPASPRTGAT